MTALQRPGLTWTKSLLNLCIAVPPGLPCIGLILLDLFSGFPFLLEWRSTFVMRTTRLSMLQPYLTLLVSSFSLLACFPSAALYFFPQKSLLFSSRSWHMSFLCPLNHFSPTSLPVNVRLFVQVQFRFCFLRESHLNLLDLVRFLCNTLCSM